MCMIGLFIIGCSKYKNQLKCKKNFLVAKSVYTHISYANIKCFYIKFKIDYFIYLALFVEPIFFIFPSFNIEANTASIVVNEISGSKA